MTTPPAKLKSGSIALGGLLTGTPSSGMPTTPLGQGTPYGSLPTGSSGGFLGSTAGFGGPASQPQPMLDPAIAHIGSLPQPLQPQQQQQQLSMVQQQFPPSMLGLGSAAVSTQSFYLFCPAAGSSRRCSAYAGHAAVD